MKCLILAICAVSLSGCSFSVRKATSFRVPVGAVVILNQDLKAIAVSVPNGDGSFADTVMDIPKDSNIKLLNPLPKEGAK